MTSTTNQKTNKNNDVSTIDLGECENKLKDIYNISFNDSLYIFKVDLKIEHIHKVEYEVYYPFLPNNLTLLNLSDCKNMRVDISIPFEIPKGQLDKYNKSSALYNSICITSTSEDGTDEPYKDRQNNYKNNNSLKVCEEDCDFNEYDIKNKKALCSCSAKIKLPAISEIKIDEKRMYSNFKNIKNIANFKMLECIYLLFDKTNIFKNSSNYMMIILMTLSIVSLFDFICHNYLKIKNNINEFSMNVVSIQKQNEINNINNNINKINSSNKRSLAKRESNIIIHNKKKDKNIPIELLKKPNNNNSSFSFVFDNNLIANNINNSINKKEIIKSKKVRKANKKKIITKKNANTFSSNKSNKEFNSQLNSKCKIDENKIINDNEINLLEYEEARQKDKRTYCQYYFSLLKTKHILIFFFFQFGDYNSQAIKIYIFFFTFSINYVVSSMFYSDDTMHKINVDKGSFDLAYQLPIMIYSFLISTTIETIINNLGLYEEDILLFKNSKNKDLLIQQKVLFRIKCKIVLFYIITYILLFFFWVFLGCFCAVYKNTQIHLLIDVLSSFGLSFISSLFINLLPGIFRIPSLIGKIKRPYLFKFSKFLEFF